MSGNKIDLKKMDQEFKKSSAEEVLRWALKTFSPKIALASSFGAEDVVLIDMLAKMRPPAVGGSLPDRQAGAFGGKIFTLDTGRLNEETYEVMDRIRKKYGVEIVSYFPEAAKVEVIERQKGFYSFRESVANRKECCGIRKVEPLNRALKGLDAWITGLRRDQSVTRSEVAKVEIDEAHGGIAKINPLADWTNEKVWATIKKNSIPYNKLHDLGYPSIGCAPCTRAVRPGEDARAGRWWWESSEHKECGLHTKKGMGDAG